MAEQEEAVRRYAEFRNRIERGRQGLATPPPVPAASEKVLRDLGGTRWANEGDVGRCIACDNDLVGGQCPIHGDLTQRAAGAVPAAPGLDVLEPCEVTCCDYGDRPHIHGRRLSPDQDA